LITLPAQPVDAIFCGHTMPTITTGTFFLSRSRPETGQDANGAFRLTLRVLDRQGPHRVEPYVAHWSGPAAALWFNEHSHELQPGRPLDLELHNPHTLPGLRVSELHATVVRCSLARVAPSWANANRPNNPQASQPA